MEENAYVLGTDFQELHRLGIQHQVWSSEARKAWQIAEFSAGQVILDLGCGPGFCSTELAYMVGSTGKVIAVDQSAAYIDFLIKNAKLHGLNIDCICASFDEMQLPINALDGIYSRWALPWINNVEEVLEKVIKSMRPGAVFVAHEYYDWRTFQTEPKFDSIENALRQAFTSMNDAGGDMNIGRKLPALFNDLGLEVISVRPMNKFATPDALEWQWPKTYFETYFPRLVPDYLSSEEVESALSDIENLEFIEGSSLMCPSMVEVVAAKP